MRVPESGSNNNSPPTPRFSPREQQVAELIAQGLSNREIGLALGISYLTVKEHVRRVYAKIGVTHRVAAVLWMVCRWGDQGRPIVDDAKLGNNGNGQENQKLEIGHSSL